jgi:hypothetical protein
VLALTCSEPPGEVTHWTGCSLAQAVGISLRSVQRIWDAHRLQPHRVHSLKRSNDPAFAAKVEDIVGPTQRQAVDPHAEFLEPGHGRAHVHGVAAEPVELDHDQNVARLEPVEQAGEPAALPDRGGSRDGLGHEAARLDGEASGLDLGELVVGGLAGGRYAEVGEGARHEANSSENPERN